MARTPRTPPGTGYSWGRLSSLSDSAGSQASRPDPRLSTAKKPHPCGGSRSVHNREIRAIPEAAPSQRLDPFEGVTRKNRPASEVRNDYMKSNKPRRTPRAPRKSGRLQQNTKRHKNPLSCISCLSWFLAFVPFVTLWLREYANNARYPDSLNLPRDPSIHLVTSSEKQAISENAS
jgi:hypothetical protein